LASVRRRIFVGKLEIDVAEVRKLVELVEKHHLDELTVEHADVSITVKRKTAQTGSPVVVEAAAHAHAEPIPVEYESPEPVAEPSALVEGNIVNICAPLVGVFYRSPSPDAPAFVEVGDVIEVGSEVGLIEAMKVFSPIPSEIAGEVVEVPVENGKLVREGDVLVRVRISEE
jgi:acetyl-CoA carboxylase biotin carboxyl carrier protein